ncbi:uncharacterized protein LOC115050374 isoform X2 [Echeneis naucrates]|uniref:uncharacterized protein LOC115050374 isoform X2 n=1 Tax=Echeneis naucrates TaxID=173247 RepID=UPI001114235E|nr:uncharacterized protein LOC115050374 isoform X2 [Echeneis naucrates]
MMTFNFNFVLIHRSHQLLKAIWKISAQCCLGSVAGGVLSASRRWLRQFILLKAVIVLLLPHGAGIPLLAGCVLSLRALLLLRSPHISTKPSTVFLGQLALSDSLILLQWALRLGAMMYLWMEEEGCGLDESLMKKGESFWWRESVIVLCHQLLDAHHLASLLLLGLLGLEATLVSRWPQQTRSVRTSHWAYLTCSLVWILVLLELMLSMYSRLQNTRTQASSLKLQNCPTSYVGVESGPSLPAFLRRILWLGNLWLLYSVLCRKAQRMNNSLD